MNKFYGLIKQLKDDLSVGDSAPEPERTATQIHHQIVSVTDVETADFLTARNRDETIEEIEENQNQEQVE